MLCPLQTSQAPPRPRWPRPLQPQRVRWDVPWSQFSSHEAKVALWLRIGWDDFRVLSLLSKQLPDFKTIFKPNNFKVRDDMPRKPTNTEQWAQLWGLSTCRYTKFLTKEEKKKRQWKHSGLELSTSKNNRVLTAESWASGRRVAKLGGFIHFLTVPQRLRRLLDSVRSYFLYIPYSASEFRNL